jgi:predicted permease
MLARVAARDREYAVRSALGAPKGRLARLALTESLLLAVAAGGAGLALASLMLRAFVGMAPADIPKIGQAALDLRVFVVAAGLALLVGVGVGLWPALSVVRRNLVQGTRTTSAPHPRMRFALVSAQIALTLAMLGGSALLVRSLIGQIQVPLGFESGGVVTMPFMLDAARYRTEAQQAAFFDEVLERVRQAPGVETAALSAAASPRGTAIAGFAVIEVRDRPPDPDGTSGPGTQFRVRDATPGYFETFRIPIQSGRAFVEADRRSVEPAAIVSESLKSHLFGDQDAVDQRIRFLGTWYTIVGVAADVRNQGVADDSVPELYVVRSITPDYFSGRREAHLSVRTTTNFAGTKAFLAQAVAEIDPLVPVTIESLDQQVAGLTERPRFVASLTSAFSGVALLLAAAGLYGVASYLVTQRTRDIGVRLALGATPGRVSGQLAGEAVRWILGGTALGLVLMWSTNQFFESQLFGISPTDGQSIVLAVVVLLVALLVALSGPIVRAARVDPMAALRDE